ncbi:MAG: hypothetical protein GEV12_07990 [Micromonosporaceae bacterium]|nr:hypothetical protein [Micromonosporaceae bacterium]
MSRAGRENTIRIPSGIPIPTARPKPSTASPSVSQAYGSRIDHWSTRVCQTSPSGGSSTGLTSVARVAYSQAPSSSTTTAVE